MILYKITKKTTALESTLTLSKPGNFIFIQLSNLILAINTLEDVFELFDVKAPPRPIYAAPWHPPGMMHLFAIPPTIGLIQLHNTYSQRRQLAFYLTSLFAFAIHKLNILSFPLHPRSRQTCSINLCPWTSSSSTPKLKRTCIDMPFGNDQKVCSDQRGISSI